MCFFDSDVNCPFNCPLVSDFWSLAAETFSDSVITALMKSISSVGRCWMVRSGSWRCWMEWRSGFRGGASSGRHKASRCSLKISHTVELLIFFYRIIKTTCRLKLSQRPSQDAWENICRHLVFRGGTSERWAAVIQQSMTIKKHFIVKRMHMIETEVQFLNRCQTTAATPCWWNDACSPTELVISVFCQRD